MTEHDDALLTVTDLATRLRIEPATVRQWARDGRLPPPLRLTERSLRWDRATMTMWLRGRIGAGRPGEHPIYGER